MYEFLKIILGMYIYVLSSIYVFDYNDENMVCICDI